MEFSNEMLQIFSKKKPVLNSFSSFGGVQIDFDFVSVQDFNEHLEHSRNCNC